MLDGDQDAPGSQELMAGMKDCITMADAMGLYACAAQLATALDTMSTPRAEPSSRLEVPTRLQ